MQKPNIIKKIIIKVKVIVFYYMNNRGSGTTERCCVLASRQGYIGIDAKSSNFCISYTLILSFSQLQITSAGYCFGKRIVYSGLERPVFSFGGFLKITLSLTG